MSRRTPLSKNQAGEDEEMGLDEAVSEDGHPGRLERRRHGRHKFHIPVRFMFGDRSEDIFGELRNISAGGIALTTKVHAKIGASLVLYIDELGQFEGRVVRVFDGGFAVELTSSERKQKRTDKILDWYASGKKGALDDERRHPRAPASQTAQLRRPNGIMVPCQVVDISMSGIGLEMDNPPNVGEIVQIGQTRGIVVRRFGRSIGIEFVGPDFNPEQ